MALPAKNTFVAALFAAALAMLLVAAIDIGLRIEYQLYGQPAVMSLADPGKKGALYEDGHSFTHRDVVYSSEAGVVEMPGRPLPKALAARLDLGQSAPIVYLTNKPKRVFYDGDKPKIEWIYLVVGIVLMATAVFALRLRKREAGY